MRTCPICWRDREGTGLGERGASIVLEAVVAQPGWILEVMMKSLNFIQIPQALKAMRWEEITHEWPQREGEEGLWLSPGWLWHPATRSHQRMLRTAALEEEAEQSPEHGGRKWELFQRKGGSADSSTAGATTSPEAARPHLPSSVHAALVLGHLPARSTASGLNSDWERPLQNIFPRRWKHLRCLIRLCLPSTAYVSL